MKRLVFLVLAVCMLAMGFAVTCGAEEALLPAAPEVGPVAEVAEPNLDDTEVRPHWQVVLEDEILPIVAVVITGAASVYIMLLPVLTGMLVAVKKVKGATKLFAGATDGVLKASASSATTEERVLLCLILRQRPGCSLINVFMPIIISCNYSYFRFYILIVKFYHFSFLPWIKIIIKFHYSLLYAVVFIYSFTTSVVFPSFFILP